jgi:hypothetical protein
VEQRVRSRGAAASSFRAVAPAVVLCVRACLRLYVGELLRRRTTH